MTAIISLPNPRPLNCTLCGCAMPYAPLALLQGPGDENGEVCGRCLWSLVDSDDPCEWLLSEARSRESWALALQGTAERLRRLAASGVELPSREELDELHPVPHDDDIPF